MGFSHRLAVLCLFGVDPGFTRVHASFFLDCLGDVPEVIVDLHAVFNQRLHDLMADLRPSELVRGAKGFVEQPQIVALQMIGDSVHGSGLLAKFADLLTHYFLQDQKTGKTTDYFVFLFSCT